MRRPPTPRQKTERIEFTLMESLCLMSAWSGQTLEQVKKWKIPYYIKMMKSYMKDVQMRRVNL